MIRNNAYYRRIYLIQVSYIVLTHLHTAPQPPPHPPRIPDQYVCPKNNMYKVFKSGANTGISSEGRLVPSYTKKRFIKILRGCGIRV